MKPKSKLLSLLLTICLVVGLMPTAAFAAGTDTGKAIQLGTSGISGYDSAAGYDYIYFGSWTAQDTYTTSGPIKWRVLDDQTNTGGTGLFLLSDGLLGTGYYGGVYFDNTSPYSNTWQGSDAQAWCNTFASSNLDSRELAAILETTKSDDAFTSSTYSVPFAASENILNGDKVFFLSAEEAENSAYGFANDNARIANYGGSACAWWLRSPYAYLTNCAGAVYGYGNVDYINVDGDWAARPAFNLDLNSVLFTSAAEGGKIPAANGGGNQGGEAAAIFEIGDYTGNEWKLTILDEGRSNFSASTQSQTTVDDNYSDWKITLNYENAMSYDAETAPNEYISVIIADSNGSALYYGRVAQPADTDGKVEITIPTGLDASTYTLYAFSEQYNGDYKTDYASEFSTITLTVNDTTAPILSDGSATRDSETDATVTFTSDEAGSYYYAVVDDGAAEPVITTTGPGTSCAIGENILSLTNLSGTGAKDIYIVAKDAAGNVSQSLKIEIPAYTVIPKTYTLTVDLNGGSGGTTGGTYPASEVVNINAGSRSNYRFDGWTSSNGGSFADASSASTSFTMPAANTTITANWRYIGGGGSTTDYYRLTFETNGGSEISSIRRAEYTTIDLTDYTPTREGYEFTGWYADENLTEKITSIRLTRNTTVYAGWEEIKENPGTGFENPFTDVSENDWFFNDVKFVYQNGLMNGTSATTFSPEGTTSRGMIVTILWRMAGSPDMEDKIWGYPFADVDATAYYGTAVYWARLNGIAGGYDDATFGPNDPITREQMAAILYRYAQYKGYDVSAKADLNKFTDADEISNYALEALQWANAEGLINGKGDGVLDPKGQATRAEAAAILTRFNEVVAE